jgi:RNA polymerase sigma-70 factor (ECF subfamily)
MQWQSWARTMEETPKSGEQDMPGAHHIGEQQVAQSPYMHPEQAQDVLDARLRAGECSAAADLVDRYYEQIYLFMRRLGHDVQVSEDLTQETFLNAWYHIGQLRDGKALSSWLYRIAANVSRLHWRRHKDRDASTIEKVDVAGNEPGGAERLGQNEELKRVRVAVSQLPVKLRQVVVLHYMQHLTIAEAAEASGVRQGTFKSRLNRALRMLKRQMAQKQEQP